MKKTDDEMLALIRDEAVAFADFGEHMERYSAGAKSDVRMRQAMQRHRQAARAVRCASLMRIDAHQFCHVCNEIEQAA